MLHIIKIGGNLIDNKHLLKITLDQFCNLKFKKILVHGGGVIANQLLKKIGISPNIVNGRRITDAKTLDFIVMTYAGLINKTITVKLQSMGCNAIGLSGVDVNLINATQRVPGVIDYKYVGDLNKGSVNRMVLLKFLDLNFVPVFCPITHNGKGTLLNTNSDTIASALAISLAEKKKIFLHYCFEKKGVLKDPQKETTYFKSISFSEFKTLKKEKIISQGMIPKLENAFNALRKGVYKVSIGHPTFLNSPEKKTILCL